MAALFAIIVLAIVAMYFSQRRLAIAFWAIGIILSIAMLWHHATDYLKINW